MKCLRCGNTKEELFFYKDGKCICRNCLKYRNVTLKKERGSNDPCYQLKFNFTNDQIRASEFIVNHIKSKKDCILSAVTGAGKTEIIYEGILYCIKANLKVGVVIPRKDVVIELYSRIKRDFKNCTVKAFYGGCQETSIGDINILTSHQLYKFNNYFDVVIIDEVDAFPFYNNDLLKQFLKNSSKGIIIYMSATIPKSMMNNNIDTFYLKTRYHGAKLDIPKIKYWFPLYSMKRFIKRHKESINIIYFPTIKLQLKYSQKLKIKHYVINSKTGNRNNFLKMIHEQKSAVILSTLVLERGVTFPNTNVFVYRADHELYNSANLVQMAGRVGRKKEYAHGEIIFFVNSKNKSVKRAIKLIKKYNE